MENSSNNSTPVTSTQPPIVSQATIAPGAKPKTPKIDYHKEWAAVIKSGDLDLISKYAAVNTVHFGDEWPLNRAVHYNNLEAIKLLVSKGADLTKCENILTLACQGINSTDIVKYLFDTGIKLTDGEPLRLVSLRGDIDMVNYLISKGADHTADEPVFAAISGGHTKLVEFYLSKRKKINANQFLIAACETGNLDIVKIFVDKGGKIDADQNSPLRCAARTGKEDVVRFLIEKGANVKAKRDYAICQAARHGYLGIVRILAEHGADIHANNDAPLDLSIEHRFYDVTKYLLDSGANLDSVSESQKEKYQDHLRARLPKVPAPVVSAPIITTEPPATSQ